MMFCYDSGPRGEVWSACESPIEQRMCVGLFELIGCKAVSGIYSQTRRRELAELAGGKPTAFLFSQHGIGIYRADFLIVVIDPIKRLSRRLIIECDGRAYHSSRDQIERDNRRDAEIIGAGYTVVLRFLGSELHADFMACVERIADLLRDFGVPSEPRDAPAASLLQSDRAILRDRRVQREKIWRGEQEAAERAAIYATEGF